MSGLLTFKVELEFDTSPYIHARHDGELHNLYRVWVDSGKGYSGAAWSNLSEHLLREIDINDLSFWVEDVEMIK